MNHPAEDPVLEPEAQRLASLDSYLIMDTPRESDFDDVVKVAAQLCGKPMALISLVDARRQWFKAAVGLDVPETPREIAFCHHAIQQPDLFQVEDASSDPRFAENPLVTGDPNLRFYAGAPLVTPDGHALGTLCVLDTRPGALTAEQRFALSALARQVILQLELRKALAESRAEAERRQLLTRELQHRIKNMLATAQAIVSQTLRSSDTDLQLRLTIADRLMTLGRAHDLITASTWKGAALRDVIDTAISGVGADAARFNLVGPHVELNAKAAMSLSLGLHELVTNAVAHGALSNAAGRVDVDWLARDGQLKLDWRESAGPNVTPPTRTGFGSRLVERVLAAELGGKAKLDYAPSGLTFALEAPLSRAGI